MKIANLTASGLVRGSHAVVCIVVATGLLTACSKTDKYKEIFMRQCVIAKPMEEPCSCTYDRMAAEVPMEAIALALETGKQDPKVAHAITSALATCTAKYR